MAKSKAKKVAGYTKEASGYAKSHKNELLMVAVILIGAGALIFNGPVLGRLGVIVFGLMWMVSISH